MRRWPPALFLVGVVLLGFWREAAGIALPLFEDAAALHHPMKVALARSLAAGELPLWTPDILAGYPLVADGQVGAFYPPNLLLFGLLSPERAYGLALVLHLLLGGLLMYGFTRRLEIDRLGALVAACAFALGGFFVGHIAHLNFVLAGVWLPALFWMAGNAARGGGARPTLLWGCAFAMMLTAAAPQLALYGAAGSWAYFMYSYAARPNAPDHTTTRGGIRDLVGLPLIGLGCGLALAAAQLLPQYELAAVSSRHDGLAFAAAMKGSFPPFNLITFIWPGVFGLADPDRYFYAGTPLNWWIVSWWETAVYIGVVPLLLALLALRRPRRPGTPFFVGLAVVSLLVAFGRYTPLGMVVHALPGFGYFRLPARASIVTVFALCVLAGMGHARLRTRAEWSAAATLARRTTLAMLAALVLLHAVDTLARPWVIDTIDRAQRARPAQRVGEVRGLHPDSRTLARVRYANAMRSIAPGRYFILAPLLASAGLWGAALLNRRSRRARLMLTLPLLLTAADLCGFGARLVPHVPVARVRATPDIAAVLHSNPAPGRIWIAPDIEPWWRSRYPPVRDAPVQANPSEALRAFLWPDMNMVQRVPGIQGANVIRPYRYDEILDLLWSDPRAARRWLDLLNVRYVLSPAASLALPGLRPLRKEGAVWVHENLTAQPRAWVASGYRVVPGLDARLTAVPADWDPTREVLLEDDPAWAPSRSASPNTAVIVGDTDDDISIDTTTSAGGLLVLADQYYPGWHAFVDGREQPLLRANYVMRAVAVPSGTHRVRFRYQPRSIRRGLAISGVALAGVAIALLAIPLTASRSERRRSRSSR